MLGKQRKHEDAEHVELQILLSAQTRKLLDELVQKKEAKSYNEVISELVVEAHSKLQSPEEISEELNHSGWLERRTFFKSWRKQWCVLDSDQQSMLWYNSPTETSRFRGKTDVDRATVASTRVSKKGTAFTFELKTRSGKVFAFRATSAQRREKWIKSITSVAKQTEEILKRYMTEDECVNCIARVAEEAKEDSIDKEEGGELSDTEFVALTVQNVNGETLTMKQILSSSRFTLLVLLRHFG